MKNSKGRDDALAALVAGLAFVVAVPCNMLAIMDSGEDADVDAVVALTTNAFAEVDGVTFVATPALDVMTNDPLLLLGTPSITSTSPGRCSFLSGCSSFVNVSVFDVVNVGIFMSEVTVIGADNAVASMELTGRKRTSSPLDAEDTERGADAACASARFDNAVGGGGEGLEFSVGGGGVGGVVSLRLLEAFVAVGEVNDGVLLPAMVPFELR